MGLGGLLSHGGIIAEGGSGGVTVTAYFAIDAGTRFAYKGGMDVTAYLRSSEKTISQLAREVGCSKGHISDLANGRRRPGKKTALKLEKVSGIPWWKWMARA